MTSRRNPRRRPDDASSLSGATLEPLPGAPPTTLHVLLVEDSAADADLILHELRQGGYEPVARRVASCGDMLEAVNDGSWQLVLLDYSMEGGGTALEALASLAELDIDLPAILISGEIGVEEAGDALRAGARDFVNKGNLTRLVPAVARELAQVEARHQPAEWGRGSGISRRACSTGPRGSSSCSGSSRARSAGRTRSSSGSSIPTTATWSGPVSSRRSSTTRLRSSTELCGRTGPSAGTSASRSASVTQTGGSA